MPSDDGEGCGPWDGVQYLTSSSDDQMAFVGECGAYQRVVSFQMPAGAPDDGFIVQRVESRLKALEPNAQGVCDVATVRESILYELFPIRKGDVSPFEYLCDVVPQLDTDGHFVPGRLHPDGSTRWLHDTNRIGGVGNSDGTVRYVFDAHFYSVGALGTYEPFRDVDGVAYWRSWRSEQAGDLCSATFDSEEEEAEFGPEFWDPKARNVHRVIEVDWACCSAIKPTSVIVDNHCR